MDFYAAIRSALSKYATFNGRASRSEFWFFYLFLVLVDGVASIIDAFIINNPNSPLTAITALVFLIPLIAVATRRLHDIDRSGWWQLLVFVPIVGAIVLIIWLCTAGSPESNRFGNNPLSGRV
jgi:uncharacterized membrane protein YhaH (DUF805 family)